MLGDVERLKADFCYCIFQFGDKRVQDCSDIASSSLHGLVGTGPSRAWL